MVVFNDKNYEKGFNSGKHPYPGGVMGDDVDRHCRMMAEYIYGAYCSNKTSFACGGGLRGRSMSELRDYGRGTQPTDKYDEWFDPVDENGEQHVNISRDIVQIMPKFRDRIKGKFEEVQFDFNVVATDPIARKERELKRAKRRLSIRPEMQSLIQLTGVKPSDWQDPEGMVSDKDIDLFYSLGGERLAYEYLMKAAVGSVEYESEWNNELKDRLIDDLIDLNAFASMTFVEEKTGKVKEKYIDPERVIIQKTEHNNHKDATYGGVLQDYTIGKLRLETGLDEEQLKKIAKKYMNFPVNKGMAGVLTSSINSFRDWNHNQAQYPAWSQITCQVLDFCFVAAEAEKYVIGRHHKMNNLIFDKVSMDSELSTRDEKRGKAFLENAIQYVYVGKWIVGTEHVFDCRKEYGTARKGNPGFKEAILPLHVYCGDAPSLVARCIGFIDDIQLATLKKRNTLAKLPPAPRMVIDISKLHDTVTIGKKTYHTMDLVRAFPKEGILIVKSKGEFDYLNQGAANGNPIQFMDSGVVQDLQLFLNEVIDGINKIKMVTGIEDAIDMNNNADVLVGVMKGVEAQTDTTLRPLYKAYKIMNINTRKYWMLKWQVVLSARDVDVTYMPLGANTVKAANLSNELTYYDFGLQVDVLPSNEERVMFMQQLIQNRDAQTIDLHHFFAIKQLVDNNMMKLAQLYLTKAVREKADEMRQLEMDKIKANGDANSQPILAEADAAMRKMDLEYKLKTQLAQEEARLEDWKNEQQFNREQMKAGVEMAERITTGQTASMA